MPSWYEFSRSTVELVIRLLLRPEVRGREKIPQQGGLILAANHVSYWDPPLVGVLARRECRYIAKEELFRFRPIGALLRSVGAFPLRRGGLDRRSLGRGLAELRRGLGLVIFPEGGRSRAGRLQRPRPGVGLMVAHTRVPVVPIYLDGTNRFRHWILRGERVRVRIGDPLSAERLLAETASHEGRERYRAIAERILAEIAELGRALDREETKSAPGPTERGASNVPGGSSSHVRVADP